MGEGMKEGVMAALPGEGDQYRPVGRVKSGWPSIF